VAGAAERLRDGRVEQVGADLHAHAVLIANWDQI
jgi:hypothetical protein